MAYFTAGARTFGAAVRQRSVREETTMARAGTLPSFTSTRERCDRVSQSPLNGPGNNGETKPKKQTSKTAYWSTFKTVAKIWMTSHFLLITARSTMMSLIARQLFLLRTVSRFGRTVRFNNRIIV